MMLRILWLVALPLTLSFGQTKLHVGHSFQDGVYAQHQDLLQDQPSHPLYALPNFGYQLDRQQNLLFLSQRTLDQLPNTKLKSLDAIWGICVKGVPYIKVQPEGKSGVTYFVRYHLIGRICYFYYPAIEDEAVNMPIYDPWIGKQVGGRTITNRERRLVKKMMWLETGEVQPYEVEVFRAWAKEDERVMQTLAELTDHEATQKLFKLIQIFNDRNPVVVPRP